MKLLFWSLSLGQFYPPQSPHQYFLPAEFPYTGQNFVKKEEIQKQGDLFFLQICGPQIELKQDQNAFNVCLIFTNYRLLCEVNQAFCVQYILILGYYPHVYSLSKLLNVRIHLFTTQKAPNRHNTSQRSTVPGTPLASYRFVVKI